MQRIEIFIFEQMQLHLTIQHVFTQLSATLSLLQQTHYSQPCHTLSHATIGQHTRHIIEMFQCLLLGYDTGVINYEKRKRDHAIETDKRLAIELLQQVNAVLEKENKPLVMEASYRDDSADSIYFDTNYFREIAYNLEHTIHHMALIKVGMLEISDIPLPEEFGVASSTIKHRKECAQ